MSQPAQLSTYFADSGPTDGPLIRYASPPTIGVRADLDGPPVPIGTAHATGFVMRRHQSVATFRLVIGGQAIAGIWVCVGRRFLPADEWTGR